MPLTACMGDADEQVVFAWGAGEDGQLCLEEAPSGEDEWHVTTPTVRASAALRCAVAASARPNCCAVKLALGPDAV
jgi:hypothetical protein